VGADQIDARVIMERSMSKRNGYPHKYQLESKLELSIQKR